MAKVAVAFVLLSPLILTLFPISSFPLFMPKNEGVSGALVTLRCSSIAHLQVLQALQGLWILDYTLKELCL